MKKQFGIVIAVVAMVMMVGIADAQDKTSKEKQSATAPLAVGDKATDFDLQTIDGKVKLSSFSGENGKPVVLLFSRANW